MKSKKRPVSLVVTLVVLAGAGFGAYKYFNKPAKITFLKAQVSRGSLESAISATGTLTATRLVPVGSQVSGKVIRMLADYNTQVRRGQLLAEIDPSTFQITLEQREASLRSAETQRLQAQVAEKRADLDVANANTTIKNQEATLNRVKSQETEAKRQYDIQVGLAKDGIASTDAVTRAKVAWEQAILSTESAEAQLIAAKASLESTKAQREVTLTQKVSAEAQITQAKAQVQDAQNQLGFTKITSPVEGVVINRKLNEGETVAASMTTPQLFEIAEDLTQMHLETNIDESDISRVQLGQESTFTVDAFPGQTFRGEVVQIRRGAVNVSNVISYTVVVNVDNPDLKLFPGMTANTRIIVERVANSLRVPSSALRFRPPAELTVVGDVNNGKTGKGDFKDAQKENDSKETSSTKETSKSGKSSKETTVADSGKGSRSRFNGDTNVGSGGENGGRGNFDIEQFRGKDGQIDREKLREQFAKNGGGFDPSQFKGRANGGGGFDPSQFGRGGNFPGGGRGRAGGGGQQIQQQTVYRLNEKNELEAVRIRTGISDGNWVQLVGNNLQEGAELVTAVEGLPASAKQNNNPNFNNNNFKGNNFKGGFF